MLARMLRHESLEHLKSYGSLCMRQMKENNKRCHPRGVKKIIVLNIHLRMENSCFYASVVITLGGILWKKNLELGKW